jgi:signal transduction histidine kinase
VLWNLLSNAVKFGREGGRRQADASSTRRHDGLGLGLAIARHVVEQHGGSITASSRTGGGASFIIRLPAPPAAALSRSTPLDEFEV